MSRRSTPLERSGVNGFGDVLMRLAPLASAYVRRPVLGTPGDAAPVNSRSEVVDVGFTRCDVRAVVTVDADGRVPWPSDGDVTDPVVASIRVANATIEVTLGDPHGARAATVDERGRLRLPNSVLRAAGLTGGSRVVIARTGPRRMVVVSTDRFGIWAAAA